MQTSETDAGPQGDTTKHIFVTGGVVSSLGKGLTAASLGNLLTALTTFPMAYHIPQFYVVSRRGGLNEYNSMIHDICEKIEGILDAADVRYFSLDGRTPIDQWASTVVKAYEYSRTTHRPVMLLVNLMGG